MLASVPASMLNQIPADSGIPRFFQISSRSRIIVQWKRRAAGDIDLPCEGCYRRIMAAGSLKSLCADDDETKGMQWIGLGLFRPANRRQQWPSPFQVEGPRSRLRARF